MLSKRNGLFDRQVHGFEPQARGRIDLTDKSNPYPKRSGSFPLIHKVGDRGFNALQSRSLRVLVHPGAA